MTSAKDTGQAPPGPDPLAAYDYDLPPEMIAQKPARRRVMARLLVLGRTDGAVDHQGVCRLPRLLKSGDLLVLNNTKVVPARLWARKPSGGRVEVLLLSPGRPHRLLDGGGQEHWVLIKAHRTPRVGTALTLEDGGGGAGPEIQLIEKGRRGRWLAKMNQPALELARQMGNVPLPPYIRRPEGPNDDDRCRYQTVYAQRPGAVAAPTAGLHFSPALLSALERRGVATTGITLHVGYGTFAEPSPEDLAAGRLHAEWVEVPEEAAQAVARTRQDGGRVIAVGTTSMRALEWRADGAGGVVAGEGWCDLLIDEGHCFKAADGLLTNFHLPRTTLLMLVAALAGREPVLAAYRAAVEGGYRFYSYGDAMLIV